MRVRLFPKPQTSLRAPQFSTEVLSLFQDPMWIPPQTAPCILSSALLSPLPALFPHSVHVSAFGTVLFGYFIECAPIWVCQLFLFPQLDGGSAFWAGI